MKKYLTQMVEMRAGFSKRPGYNYVCMEDYVLDRGQQYEVRPLTAEEQKVVAKARRGEFFPEGYCYANAQRLVLADRSKKLLYVEGFASGLFPVLHAWAVINGAVVDVTWESMESKGQELYYGVELSRDVIRAKRKEKKTLAILDDWENKYPLLKQERRHREVPQDTDVLEVARASPVPR